MGSAILNHLNEFESAEMLVMRHRASVIGQSLGTIEPPASSLRRPQRYNVEPAQKQYPQQEETSFLERARTAQNENLHHLFLSPPRRAGSRIACRNLTPGT